MTNETAPAGAARLEAPAGIPAVNPEHGLPEGFGPGLAGRILFWIAVSFSVFQIVTAFGIPLDRGIVGGLTVIHITFGLFGAWALWLIWQGAQGRAVLDPVIALATLGFTFLIIVKFSGSLPSQVVRTIHVGFLCLVAGAMLANHRARTSFGRIAGWALGTRHRKPTWIVRTTWLGREPENFTMIRKVKPRVARAMTGSRTARPCALCQISHSAQAPNRPKVM